ncbi:hypothetical protein ACA910_005825 [Epithemia clementina (nom. ined.)]
MTRYFFLVCLAAAASVQASHHMDNIGTPSLSSFQYSYDTVVEGTGNDCYYTLTIDFVHNNTLPFGNPDTCQVDVVASDGKEYFASRWHYERLDEASRMATGFDHVSIDWNACGHPGFGFQTSHYDLHIYTVSPQYRATQMQCEKIHGTPVCKEESAQTGTGLGFYVLGQVASSRQFDNLPKGYEWELDAAVEFMGTHGGNPQTEPNHPNNWTEPQLYFTSFDGSICAVEPMFPFNYASGDKPRFYEEYIEYEVQTLITLPAYYSISFNPTNQITTIVMKGKAAICKEEFEEIMAEQESKNPSSAFRWGTSPPSWSSLVLMFVLGVSSFW